MTGLTAMELAGNYPENILIETSKKDNGKFASFCYRLKDGEIHKLMLSFDPVFDTDKEANDAMHDIAKTCVKNYS